MRCTCLFHLPQTTCAPNTRPRRASKRQPSSSEAGLNSTQLTFLKSPPTLPVRDVTHVNGHIHYLGFLLWHLWMTRPLRTRVNTCTHVCTQLTYALSRKVLSLTKPKGKIYNTKSLGHYITDITLNLEKGTFKPFKKEISIYTPPQTTHPQSSNWYQYLLAVNYQTTHPTWTNLTAKRTYKTMH